MNRVVKLIVLVDVEGETEKDLKHCISGIKDMLPGSEFGGGNGRAIIRSVRQERSKPKKEKEKKNITTKGIREELRGSYSEEVIEKAIAKAQRWMKAAYGCIDWEELQGETGSAVGYVIGYAEETLKEPSGINTFNRNNNSGTRRRRR